MDLAHGYLDRVAFPVFAFLELCFEISIYFVYDHLSDIFARAVQGEHHPQVPRSLPQLHIPRAEGAE